MFSLKRNTLKVILLSLTLLFSSKVFANEADNVKYYCNKVNGEIEYMLKDRTRVDCLTKDTAFEFDFAKKGYEAIGQSLHYSTLTNKKAGIYLIIKNPKEYKYINRLIKICKIYDIELIIVQDVSQKKLR